MIQKLNSGDYSELYESITFFRKVLSLEHNPPIQDVIDCGVVPRMVQLLSGEFVAPPENRERIIFEAAWALTNIASGQQSHTGVVVDCGAVPILIELLSHSNNEIREQVLLVS